MSQLTKHFSIGFVIFTALLFTGCDDAQPQSEFRVKFIARGCGVMLYEILDKDAHSFGKPITSDSTTLIASALQLSECTLPGAIGTTYRIKINATAESCSTFCQANFIWSYPVPTYSFYSRVKLD
jgi:hypothetical protein